MWKRVSSCLVACVLVFGSAACRPTPEPGASSDSEATPGTTILADADADADAGAEAASRSDRDEATLWRAASYERIRHAAQQPDAPFGTLMLASIGTDVCIADTVAMHEVYNAQRNDPDFARSLAELRAFQGRFCPAAMPVDERAHESAEMLRRVEAGDPEARLISTLLEADASLPHEDRKMLRQAAERMSTETRSPALYEALQISLLEEAFFDPATVTDRPFGMGDEALRDAWGYGVLLASCARFGHCAAGSLMVYRFCLPQHCRPGLDGTGYVRDRLSAEGYAEAERRARTLLAQG